MKVVRRSESSITWIILLSPHRNSLPRNLLARFVTGSTDTSSSFWLSVWFFTASHISFFAKSNNALFASIKTGNRKRRVTGISLPILSPLIVEFEPSDQFCQTPVHRLNGLTSFYESRALAERPLNASRSCCKYCLSMKLSANRYTVVHTNGTAAGSSSSCLAVGHDFAKYLPAKRLWLLECENMYFSPSLSKRRGVRTRSLDSSK